MYALPILIICMMLYMFWHAGFSMRRDRIHRQRLNLRERLRAVRRHR